jgi:aminobenzoyl-glutamate utilization protein B
MKFKLLLILLFCFGISASFAQNQMSKTKQAIMSSVEKHEANLIKISDEIWPKQLLKKINLQNY